jgi:hypothetical protein
MPRGGASSFNGGNWNHGGNWNQQAYHGGSWSGQGYNNWNNNWNGHYDDHHHGSWGWGYPGAWGLALGLGWGWPGGWGYGGYGGYGYGGYGGYGGGYYPYGDYYAMDYPSYYVQPAVNQPVVQAMPDVTQLQTAAQASQQTNATSTSNYFNEAVSAFRNGDYAAALRAAGHAGIEDPRSSKPHELASLALFANGDYRGAAIEAHAALALGPASNWNTIAGYYGGPNEPFTTQLRSLEQYSAQNPTAADAQFLLGYLYQGMGYPEQSKTRFAEAARLVPADQMASRMGGLTSTGVNAPPVIKPAPSAVPPNPTPATSNAPPQ